MLSIVLRLSVTSVIVFSLVSLMIMRQAYAAEITAKTFYVSALGDDTDGATWKTAYKTIQKALSAIPDETGGYRIVIRPDIYMEANLFPAYKGAPGAYNIIESDMDGRYGSGRNGLAVIDSCDPEKGLKSVDWYSAFRASPDFSGIGWDRWSLRHIYATGGDAGLFWDLPPKIEPFSITVEDSVGIGRAFGGGVAHFLPRPNEPITFLRCYLSCLDWWGDAAGAYVRCENETLSLSPDVTFQDCTLVSPDNALQAGNPGYAGYTRVKLSNCKLITMNFSQPRGTPSTGIIQSTIEGKLLHVDMENCTLLGYKVFGSGDDQPIPFTTTGSVQACVQFEQDCPEGIHRLGHWPTSVFGALQPPPLASSDQRLIRDTTLLKNMCEVSPIVWKDKPCLMYCNRPASSGQAEEFYLTLVDVETGKELARFAEGYGLASALVHNAGLYVFASRHDNDGTWNDVTQFHSTDLVNWEKRRVVQQDAGEHLFNSSVTKAADGFVMAYESDVSKYPAFTIKFARSSNLTEWTKATDCIFGADRYTACPAIRYSDGHFYVLYLERRAPRWFFETYIARSTDLKSWELSPQNPVLSPEGLDEGINTSDVDLIEFGGATHVYFAVGDQRTWMNTKRAVYAGPQADLLASYFPKSTEPFPASR